MIYDVAKSLHEGHGVSKALYDEAVKVLTERGLVEIIGLCGYYTMVSMTLNTFEFESAGGRGVRACVEASNVLSRSRVRASRSGALRGRRESDRPVPHPDSQHSHAAPLAQRPGAKRQARRHMPDNPSPIIAGTRHRACSSQGGRSRSRARVLLRRAGVRGDAAPELRARRSFRPAAITTTSVSTPGKAKAAIRRRRERRDCFTPPSFIRRRPALADALHRVMQAGIHLDGASDHGVSEALYLRDPDENGVELYCDRPQGAMAAQAGRIAGDVHASGSISRICCGSGRRNASWLGWSVLRRLEPDAARGPSFERCAASAPQDGLCCAPADHDQHGGRSAQARCSRKTAARSSWTHRAAGRSRRGRTRR